MGKIGKLLSGKFGNVRRQISAHFTLFELFTGWVELLTFNDKFFAGYSPSVLDGRAAKIALILMRTMFESRHGAQGELHLDGTLYCRECDASQCAMKDGQEFSHGCLSTRRSAICTP